MKPCERAWCIDRVQGHRLQGHTRRTMNASSRQHCLELCLGERDFLCRWVWNMAIFRLLHRESYSTDGRFPATWFFFPSSVAISASSVAGDRGGGRTRLEIQRESTHGAQGSSSLFSSSSSRSWRIESTSTRSGAFSSYWVPRSRRRTLHHAPTESGVFLGHEAAIPDVSCELEHRRERSGYLSGKVAEK